MSLAAFTHGLLNLPLAHHRPAAAGDGRVRGLKRAARRLQHGQAGQGMGVPGRRQRQGLRARADDRVPAQVMIAGREQARGLPDLAVGEFRLAQPAFKLGSQSGERHDPIMPEIDSLVAAREYGTPRSTLQGDGAGICADECPTMVEKGGTGADAKFRPRCTCALQ